MKRRTRILLVVGVVITVAIGLNVAIRQMRKPPIEALKAALAALDTARAAGANTLARSQMAKAQDHYRRGEEVIRRQNEAWWPWSSYREADSLIAEAVRLAREATTAARQEVRESRRSVSEELRRMGDELARWRQMLDGDLRRSEIESLHGSARRHRSMAQEFVERDALEAATTHLDSARHYLADLQIAYEEQQERNDSLSVHSAEWIRAAMQISDKSGRTALIVDKQAHQLYTVRNGAVVDSCACELGFNSGHQKLHAGDRATPEGLYRVTQVKTQSKYYRALLLDYPNADDRKRFDANKRNGVISRDARIGGLIEVHGHGGKGSDWTDGCVAVTNDEMAALMRICEVGTPVAVVRSWKQRR